MVTLTKSELGPLLTVYRARIVAMIPAEDKKNFYYDEEAAMQKYAPAMYSLLKELTVKLRA